VAEKCLKNAEIHAHLTLAFSPLPYDVSYFCDGTGRLKCSDTNAMAFSYTIASRCNIPQFLKAAPYPVSG